MANFDTSALAMAALCPNNKMITDDAGMPGFYVQHGVQKLSALLTNGDNTVHPAFRCNGVEQASIFIGKYQGVADNNRIYSLPGVDPRAWITLDTYEAYCHNKGFGHHCITAAEWAFLALWCRKNNCMPKGNNNYGKDVSETEYLAIPATFDSDGKITHILTGTGPLTWRHNGQLDGICDLNGNIWEWTAGIRLVKGELQAIPYNNAASNDTDTSAKSAQWKAIKADAASWEELFITPNGQGTTAGSVKLDYVSGHWAWVTSISSQSDEGRGATFAATTSTNMGATAKLYLQAMALLPEDGATADSYGGDYFYANNGADERCALRGGYWPHGTLAGVFYLNFSNPRSDSTGAVGGRPAFVELETE